MQKETVSNFRIWFDAYVANFYPSPDHRSGNILLKEEHSRRVCAEALNIAGALHFSEADVYLAEVAALFHDLGRFKQWQIYGTFRDDQSENHAFLGLRVLEEYRVLAELTAGEQELIRLAIQYHNVLNIPEMENQRAILLTRLLRDADKLDIWRLFVGYFSFPLKAQDCSVVWDLPETSGYSEKVLSDLHHQRITSSSYLKNRNDFKLALLSWVFDTNFDYTRQQILEREYIEQIAGQLPQSSEILQIKDDIISYLKRLRLAKT